MAVPLLRHGSKAAQTSDDSAQNEQNEQNESPSPAYSTNGVAAYTPAGVLKKILSGASDIFGGTKPAY